MPTKKSPAIKLTPQEKELLVYLELGQRHGCPPDQIANFYAAGWIGEKKQLSMAAAARSCDVRCQSCQEKHARKEILPEECKDCGPIAIGVGGARGGGKTRWMAAQVMIDDCVRYPGLKGLYVRKSGKSIRKQIRELLTITFPKTMFPDPPYNFKEQAMEIYFKNGSAIDVGHFKDEASFGEYQGHEYDFIAFEELTMFTHEKYESLMTCLRTSKTNWRPRAYAAWNWGGIGHQWVKSLFYDPWKNGNEVLTRYIFATAHDNSHNNPEYINTLKKLPGWKFTSWYEGNPDFQAGAFFANWNILTTVYPNETILFPANPVRWFASMDYGFKHPNVFHLHAEDEHGNIFTTDEYSERECLIQEHVSNMRDLLAMRHLDFDDLEFIAAGHDCFKTDKDGSTVATEYDKLGVRLTAVHIDRVNAWSQMQERLGDASRGIMPTWFIHKNCENLIAQIPVAQVNLKKPGDILKMDADEETGEGGDDALEACFVAGTKIEWLNGQEPIEKIRLGTKVLTSCGYKRVLGINLLMIRPVFQVVFSDGSELTGTGDHPIWTQNGWVCIDSLRNGDIVATCNLKPSSSTESNFGDTQTPSNRHTEIITGQAGTIENAGFRHSIRKFTNRIMGLIKSLRDFTSTTATATVWTTGQTTSNACLGQTILATTQNSRQSNRSGQEWTMLENSRRSGINPKNVKSFPKIIGQLLWGNVSLKKNTPANFANAGLNLNHQAGSLNFAPQNARKPINAKRDAIWREESVASVAMRSKLTNMQKPELALLNVVGVYSAGNASVYNLKVDGCPEYFANGILVHNCRNGLVMARNTNANGMRSVKVGTYKPYNSEVDLEIVGVDRLGLEMTSADEKASEVALERFDRL